MLEVLFGLVALIVLLALGAGIALVVLRARNGDAAKPGHWPFRLRQPLTEPELVLYERLCRALPDHLVLAQVHLSRFLVVRRGQDARAWYDRISRMSVDFLVCTKDASVVAAIEVEDAAQRSAERVAAETGKELALNAAGVRVLRWNVTALPDEESIQSAIAGAAVKTQRSPQRAEGPDSGTFRTA